MVQVSYRSKVRTESNIYFLASVPYKDMNRCLTFFMESRSLCPRGIIRLYPIVSDTSEASNRIMTGIFFSNLHLFGRYFPPFLFPISCFNTQLLPWLTAFIFHEVCLCQTSFLSALCPFYHLHGRRPCH